MIVGRRYRLVALALLLTSAVPRAALAWIASGHVKIAEAAVHALPDTMPPFFRAGYAEIGRSAADPDFFRLRDLPQLRNAESPEHYLDSELLDGAPWPETRYRFLELIFKTGKDPYAVGMLPYSLAEGLQKLAASFAQVRLNPGDRWARARALHHAGVMAHYAGDLCQPLHTTIHYNGRAKPDGSSPQSGIHFKTDSLVTAVFAAGPPALATGPPVDDLLDRIRREFSASHALVDRVYELEDGLGPEAVSAEALALGRERVAASIGFTAALFEAAWELSGRLDLPDWFGELQSDLADPANPAESAVFGPSR